MSGTLRELLADIPPPVQWAVFGGELPKMDVSGMRRIGAAWRECGDRSEACRVRLSASCGELPDIASGEVGFGIIASIHRICAGLAGHRDFCRGMADQCDQAAADTEKNVWEMLIFGSVVTYQVAFIVSSGGIGAVPGIALLSKARATFLEMLERYIATIGLKGAAAAGARVGLLGAAFGGGSSGLDYLLQYIQIRAGNRSHVDTKSVAAIGLQGLGAVAGGHLAITALAGTGPLLGRAVLPVTAAVGGVFGVVGGAVAAVPVTGEFHLTGTAVLAGIGQSIAGGLTAIHTTNEKPHEQQPTPRPSLPDSVEKRGINHPDLPFDPAPQAPPKEYPESPAAAQDPIHGPDPTAEDGFLDLPINEQIRRLEEAHGIRTDAERAIEMSLYMEDKFRDIALISRQARPEAIFDGGLEGWAGWLDARLFARQNLDRPMSVDLMQEIHRRLLIRYEPENAGQLRGAATRYEYGGLGRPITPNELAAIEGNSLLTHVPEPVRYEPYGVVFRPKIEGRPGAREAHWLDEPPTEELLAAIRDDPWLDYKGPGDWAPKNGMIIYPTFGTAEGTREYFDALCSWYDASTKQPGFNPYQSAAEFQKRFISAHGWKGDFQGRFSRVLMNHLLERAGKPPSAVADYDDDLLTSSSQWADAVEAGSKRYGQWQKRLKQSGGDIDPVDLLDLKLMMQRYWQMGGKPSPFTPGEYHDKERYGRLHRELRSGE